MQFLATVASVRSMLARGLCYKRRVRSDALRDYAVPPKTRFSTSGAAGIVTPIPRSPAKKISIRLQYWQRHYGNATLGQPKAPTKPTSRVGPSSRPTSQRDPGPMHGRLGYQAERKEPELRWMPRHANTQSRFYDYGDKRSCSNSAVLGRRQFRRR